jgi:hypothetical protein
MSKKFKVTAAVTTYCHLIVEADNEEQARDIAEATDGGDYFTDDTAGSFTIVETKLIP